MGHASWLDGLEPEILKVIVDNAVEKTKGTKINCIVVCGLSGLTVGAAISYLTGIPLVVVRKKSESCHSQNKIEFSDRLLKLNWIFLDDFVSCGDTLSWVIENVEKTKLPQEFLGLFLYRSTITEISINLKTYPCTPLNMNCD